MTKDKDQEEVEVSFKELDDSKSVNGGAVLVLLENDTAHTFPSL